MEGYNRSQSKRRHTNCKAVVPSTQLATAGCLGIQNLTQVSRQGTDVCLLWKGSVSVPPRRRIRRFAIQRVPTFSRGHNFLSPSSRLLVRLPTLQVREASRKGSARVGNQISGVPLNITSTAVARPTAWHRSNCHTPFVSRICIHGMIYAYSVQPSSYIMCSLSEDELICLASSIDDMCVCRDFVRLAALTPRRQITMAVRVVDLSSVLGAFLSTAWKVLRIDPLSCQFLFRTS